MGITRIGLKRPVSACMIILIVAVFGIVSLFGFSVDLLPEVKMPVLMVRTAYEGADPETVDTTVSRLVEETAETISGVGSIQSYSYEDYSLVTLQYEYGEDVTFHYMKLQNALAEAKEALRNFDAVSGNSLKNETVRPKKKGFMDKIKETFED